VEIFPPGSGEDSIHSYDFGIHPFPDGLFWMARIPHDNVRVNLHRARARLRLDDTEVFDWTTIANSLTNGDSVPARVSLDIRWSGVNRRVEVADAEDGFAGLFLEDTATIEFRSEQEGFAFVSDPAETSITHFAEIGVERNGVFFQ
jgi:hypothetical protein